MFLTQVSHINKDKNCIIYTLLHDLFGKNVSVYDTGDTMYIYINFTVSKRLNIK